MLPLRIFTTIRSPELDVPVIPILSTLCNHKVGPPQLCEPFGCGLVSGTEGNPVENSHLCMLH